MLISEMLEILQDKLKWEGDAEIRIAYQPSYPIRATVANVTFVEADEDDEDDDQQKILWIAAGDYVHHKESPYAPSSAWD